MTESGKSSAVTVIILTFNEETNIRDCVESVAWAGDVVLLDSGSTDRTVELAKEVLPSIRVFSNPFEDFGQQRNWALDNTEPCHEWILFLDADERVNDKCRQGIVDAIGSQSEHVGYFLTCTNFFLNRPIPRCTLYPSWQLRLLKLGEVRYRKEGHGQREVTTGSLEYIAQPYDHYGLSQGVAHWIARHNQYSTNEIELIARLRAEPLRLGSLFSTDAIKRRRCLKRLAARFGFRPVFRFLYLYFVRLGFTEGRAGFLYCLLRVAHEIHITVKLAEAEQQKQS